MSMNTPAVESVTLGELTCLGFDIARRYELDMISWDEVLIELAQLEVLRKEIASWKPIAM